MNATKQGMKAGQSTRRVVDKATHTTIEGGKTVVTAVSGFVKGFISGAPAPIVQAKRNPQIKAK
jgi:hypothetical protein